MFGFRTPLGKRVELNKTVKGADEQSSRGCPGCYSDPGIRRFEQGPVSGAGPPAAQTASVSKTLRFNADSQIRANTAAPRRTGPGLSDRYVEHDRCTSAICPAGPPKLSRTMRSHTRVASRNEMPWFIASLPSERAETLFTCRQGSTWMGFGHLHPGDRRWPGPKS